MKVSVATRARSDRIGRVRVNGEEPAQYKTIDWTNRSDRTWLTNHVHWAVHNEYMVTIVGPLKPTESN